MNAAWAPFSRATIIERSATMVFPAPTSPWISRFMGWGERMSSAISRRTRFFAPVRGKGRTRLTTSRVASVIAKATPLRPSRAPRRRRARPSWKRKNSSRITRRWAGQRARSVGVGFNRTIKPPPGPRGQALDQEGLVEPEGLQAPASVVEADLVEGHAAPPAQTRHRDLPRHRHPHARPQLGHPGEAAPVLVAHGQVEKQVLGRSDAQLLQGSRPLRAHAP